MGAPPGMKGVFANCRRLRRVLSWPPARGKEWGKAPGADGREAAEGVDVPAGRAAPDSGTGAGHKKFAGMGNNKRIETVCPGACPAVDSAVGNHPALKGRPLGEGCFCR
ncbi:hypothetical protein DESPIG_02265 [Desulfovibrio piger ATCC 29098]|uniref:Uncharacterized protein n=1 Tax=Desulfovibrio piger ATCC 29098 TaxID=411464 RepID=B6WVZ7_9BACT|nr:hypothetical protein DESPIG_02265 [Desulfovibrio piger ATCC 29098]